MFNMRSRRERFIGSDSELQDADYSQLPSLSDEIVQQIFARLTRSEYWKLYFVNKFYLDQIKSGELYKIRGEMGIKEPSVFMLASGAAHWWSFGRHFRSFRKLPELPSDTCFVAGDKESLCVGTHLLVCGREIEGFVIWRYELAMNRWFKGPPMIAPRCLFASANCGDFACVAGGIAMGTSMEVLDSAELYNPDFKSWDPLPRMHKKRKLCSGFYMDNKFFVIGGQSEDGDDLTCGECFDVNKNTWELIPDILKDAPASTSRSPPLLAVVNNELYLLEASTNVLKVYMKKTNSWKELGIVPVRADYSRGWGIAFKSFGDELLVIGGASNSVAGHGMTICTCRPDPDSAELRWGYLVPGRNRISHFVLNCSIMLA